MPYNKNRNFAHTHQIHQTALTIVNILKLLVLGGVAYLAYRAFKVVEAEITMGKFFWWLFSNIVLKDVFHGYLHELDIFDQIFYPYLKVIEHLI